MNTTFKTLENLLHNAIDIHHRAGLLYRSLATSSTDERCHMLLDEMAGKEDQMATLIKEFAERAQPRILNTYLQYTLEENPEDMIAAAAPEGAVTITEIGELGQKLHSYQIGLMEGALREVASGDACEILQDILQLEKAEGRAFTRRADSVYDM